MSGFLLRWALASLSSNRAPFPAAIRHRKKIVPMWKHLKGGITEELCSETHIRAVSVLEKTNSSSFHSIHRHWLWVCEDSQSDKSLWAVFGQRCGGEESEVCITEGNSSALTGEVHILFTETSGPGQERPLMMSKDESRAEEEEEGEHTPTCVASCSRHFGLSYLTLLVSCADKQSKSGFLVKVWLGY